MSDAQREKFERFRAMHWDKGAFLIPNPWDAGTARILTQLGFQALATTSAGYAFSVGKRDSHAALTRAEILENARRIVEATHLPVSADLEDGFGTEPAICAETIEMAIETGLVGGSIEDATGHPHAPIYETVLAAERIAAAADATRGKPFLLTARAENYLWGRHNLADTIERLQAYSEAGAHVLYAPGLSDLNDIRTLCREVDKPVNVVMGLVGPTFTVADLAEAGVKRISVGGSLARAALGAMMRAAEEMLEHGTFRYAKDAARPGTITEMMSDIKLTERR
ncbi:isocitrate lyase/PEP mutase family protein [Seohaeicola zhoushanensis]|uniref:2-methylisocitrate lyase n=1 Tax=Seohaeicola zhoushanensis TaxID=1569283 RepID=A0A8J3GU47_9RHOB|nr:isocitrate lyase/phosphoenolpyruvate mutase family protein [Seohaeicola zhoushanensis]GHF37781.1 2-methylisocitrate lyase [Seohaeicola zhoushanensis]